MNLPPTDPRAGEIAGKKLRLAIICAMLGLSALVILVLPVRLPLPVRLGVAFTDLVAAATVWLVGRQKLDGK